jgi:uncharacterized protein (TIGR03086 family)
MKMLELDPAALRMGDLIRGIRDDQLRGPTPCPEYTLGDLVDHIGGGELGNRGPSADGSRLTDDWRTRIPRDLRSLAEAWHDPAAWTGMTRAGGVDLPGEVAGLVALDELVIHGWDVARAAAQPYECDRPSLEAVHGFVSQFSAPGQEASREGLFGPVVDVPDSEPLLDRVIGLSGRDPGWSPH